MAEDRADGARTFEYRVPENLTRTAGHAFHTEVRMFAADLSHLTERVAREVHPTYPECTPADVLEARQRLSRAGADDPPDPSLLGASLLTVATVGVPVMANFLHSPLQVVAFGAFVVCGLAGLVLTWAGRVGKGG